MNIFCIGRNYSDHAKELGNALPTEPVIFMKPETALLQGTVLPYPVFTKDLHYEIELVLRISKAGKNIAVGSAHEHFDRIGLGIDFTARDVQEQLRTKGLPWEKAKAWDNSAVISSVWKPTAALVLEKGILFSLKKNGTTVQSGNSKEMVFDFVRVVSEISNYFQLSVGDMIYTGTPAGVGACTVGDVLEGFFEQEKMFEIKIV